MSKELQKLSAVFPSTLAHNISQLNPKLQTEITNHPTLTYLRNATTEIEAKYVKLQKQIHHELSTYKLENGSWFYVDGQFFN